MRQDPSVTDVPAPNQKRESLRCDTKDIPSSERPGEPSRRVIVRSCPGKSSCVCWRGVQCRDVQSLGVVRRGVDVMERVVVVVMVVLPLALWCGWVSV